MFQDFTTTYALSSCFQNKTLNNKSRNVNTPITKYLTATILRRDFPLREDNAIKLEWQTEHVCTVSTQYVKLSVNQRALWLLLAAAGVPPLYRSICCRPKYGKLTLHYRTPWAVIIGPDVHRDHPCVMSSTFMERADGIWLTGGPLYSLCTCGKLQATQQGLDALTWFF